MQSRTDGSPTSSAPIHLLLVGENEQDFSYLSYLLRQTGDGHLGLDHARSPEEAVAQLGQTTYDLLLCEYKSEMVLHCACRKDGAGPPVIFLSDHMNETAVDEALKAGTGDLAPTLGIDEPSATRTIRYAIDVFCKERQRQKAEDTLQALVLTPS